MIWRANCRAPQSTGLLGVLVLVIALAVSSAPVLWEQVAQANTAAPAGTAEGVDKYQLYARRLQALLDKQPFAERWWRERRAFPYFDRAARLAQQHDHHGALEEYAKYLASDPEHLMMRWQQLLTLTETDKLPETVAAASALLQHVPDFGPALLIRALTLRKLGQTEQAERDLLAARADRALVASDRTLLLSELFALALQRQDFATALSVLEEQRAYRPEAADVHESRAVLLDHLGRFTEAEEAWEQVVALTTEPQKRQQATLARARVLEKLQRFDAALTLLTEAHRSGAFALSATPIEHLKALYELTAETAIKAGKTDAAIEALEHLLAVNESTPTRLALASQLLLRGNAPRAFDVLQPLRKQAAGLARSDRVMWYTTLGNTAFAARQLPVALEAYRQALALQDTPEMRLQAAEVAWQLARYGEVVELLRPLEHAANGGQATQASAWQSRLCTAYAKQAQYHDALRCVERWIEAEPDNVDVARQAAHLAAQTQQPQRQLTHLQRVYHLQPTPTLALDIGHLLNHLNLHDEAVDWLRRAYDDGPSATAGLGRSDRVMWYTTLGNTAFAAQQLPVALEAYRQVLALQDTPEMRLQAAEVAWQLARYGEVVELLQPLEHAANGGQAAQASAWQSRLCTAYAKQAQYDAALRCLDRQLEAEPGNVEVASYAAELAAQTQQPQRQVIYLQRVYRFKPTPILALDIGHLLSRLDLHDEAVDWVRRAYDDGRSATAGLAYAQLLLKQHRQAAAIEVLRDITSRPNELSEAAQSTAYTALGYALTDTEDFHGAAEAWQHAYRLSADPVLQSRRVWALRRAGEIEQARAELDEVPIASLPAAEQVKWYEETGTLWYQLGDFQRSLEMRQKALELAPTGHHWAQLSDTLIALHRLSEADHALAEALQLHPHTPEYLTRRGYLHIALHNDRSAAEFFEQVRELDDSVRTLDGELGYLYTRLADNDKAIAAFQRAIDHASLSHVATPAEQREVQDNIASMRGQIQAMERRWSFSLVHNTCILDEGCRVDSIAAGDGASGLAFGSVEVAYQPPKIGFRNGKILQLFGRLFWSYKPEAFSLDLNEDSLQAGLGVRYKPFAAHNLWLALEHLFKIGDDTENNWLARLSWSYTRGTHWQALLDGETAPDATAPYISLYADVAKFLQHDQELLLLGEARYGRTWQRGKGWLLSPFVYALGRATINGETMESFAEGGLGLAVRLRFDFHRYWGYRREVEVLLRFGHDVHNSESELQPRALVGVRFAF